VRRALGLCGGGPRLWSSNAAHFEALLERFSEGESENRDDLDPPGASTLPHHAADTNAADRRRKGTPTRRSKLSRARTRCSTRPRRTRLAYGAISKAGGRALRAADLRGARGSGADAGAGAEMNGDGAHAMRLRKRRKGAFGGGGYVPVPVGALEEPDAVRRGDHRGLGLGQGLMSFPSNCQHHHFPFVNLN